MTVDSRASNSDGFETRVKRSAIADKQDCRAASNPEYVHDFQPMFAEVDAEFQATCEANFGSLCNAAMMARTQMVEAEEDMGEAMCRTCLLACADKCLEYTDGGCKAFMYTSGTVRCNLYSDEESKSTGSTKNTLYVREARLDYRTTAT